MPCYHPLTGYRGRGGSVVFKRGDSLCGKPMRLPCGQCIGCRLERSRQWAVRCLHEASLHADNCFVTLTYDPECLPSDGCLSLTHHQDFFKRLRSRLGGLRISYFLCGEYGERFSRPHYHACIFGYDFPDRVVYSRAGKGLLYTSKLLDEIWGHGFCSIGDVTFESAAYVARYCVKKVTGAGASDFYWRLNEVTGEIVAIEPEFVRMSRRPAVGADWFRRFGKEVFPSDEVIVRGHPCKPPRFYDKLFEAAHGDMESIKRKRALAGNREDSSEDSFAVDADGRVKTRRGRLSVREIVKEAQVSFLKRGFDHGE